MMLMREFPFQEAAVRRLLVINPNTNPAVTERIRQAADQLILPGTSITVVNPKIGPFSIETTAHREEAIPQAIDLVRSTLDDDYHAYAFACFDDIGLMESRRLASVPVVGTCEAGIAAARTLAGRFAIITTVHSAVPGIKILLNRYGAADICTVRAAGVGVAAAAAQDGEADQRILDAARKAIDEDGAEALLLGSGGLTGRAMELQSPLGVPVIDGVLAAIKMAESLASLGGMERQVCGDSK